jgi:hypothetical protein
MHCLNGNREHWRLITMKWSFFLWVLLMPVLGQAQYKHAKRADVRPGICQRSNLTCCVSCSKLWLIEAVKYNVLPLDDRMAERCNSEIAGRPESISGNRQIVLADSRASLVRKV